jgi:ribosome maturation factor RimP
MSDRLREKIEPLVQEEGLDLVEFRFSQAEPASVLRIFVDKAGGVSVDQCASLSRKLGDFLDTEDLISSRYTLEVSSPGLDRPLACGADFKRKMGERIRVFLKEKVDGRMEMVGIIKDLKQENLVLAESSEESRKERELVIPLEKVSKAKIIF